MSGLSFMSIKICSVLLTKTFVICMIYIKYMSTKSMQKVYRKKIFLVYCIVFEFKVQLAFYIVEQ